MTEEILIDIEAGSVRGISSKVPVRAISMFECYSDKDAVRCDYLCVVGIGAPAAWQVSKFLIPQQLMENEGLTTAYCYVSENSVRCWENLLERTRPRVVLIRAMVMDENIAEILANRYRHIKFVHICHSSFAFAATESIPVRISRIIHLTHRYPNVFYGHPNENEALAFKRIYGGSFRIIWLPNVVQFSNLTKRVYDSRRNNVFLTCAWRPFKNMLGQIYAVALASRIIPIRFMLSIPDFGTSGRIKEFLQIANEIPDFSVDMIRWKDNMGYIEWMAAHVDIVMQVSFTESFNYVAWEAMSLGIPSVASLALDYAIVQANPDSIEDMANTLIFVANNYDALSIKSRHIAYEIGNRLNAKFVQQLQELL